MRTSFRSVSTCALAFTAFLYSSTSYAAVVYTASQGEVRSTAFTYSGNADAGQNGDHELLSSQFLPVIVAKDANREAHGTASSASTLLDFSGFTGAGFSGSVIGTQSASKIGSDSTSLGWSYVQLSTSFFVEEPTTLTWSVNTNSEGGDAVPSYENTFQIWKESEFIVDLSSTEMITGGGTIQLQPFTGYYFRYTAVAGVYGKGSDALSSALSGEFNVVLPEPAHLAMLSMFGFILKRRASKFL